MFSKYFADSANTVKGNSTQEKTFVPYFQERSIVAQEECL